MSTNVKVLFSIYVLMDFPVNTSADSIDVRSEYKHLRPGIALS